MALKSFISTSSPPFAVPVTTPRLRPSPSSSPSPTSSALLPFRKSLSEQPIGHLAASPVPSRRTASRRPRVEAVAVESAESSGADPPSAAPRVLLEVRDLKAVVMESRQEILRGVNLTIKEGEIHAIMGKNGSGKSTLSKVLVGHPHYEVTGGSILFKGENLLDMEPEERSHVGLFLSFQHPVEIPGVSNFDFLRMALNARRKAQGKDPVEPLEFYSLVIPKISSLNMDPKFLDRNVNEGFSGGEKKRNEILQLAVLEADLAVLDEIDSGLDVDALQDVAKAVNGFLTPKNSLLMITHYQRLLDYISPSFIHIMENGMIVKTGDASLAKKLEKEGYRALSTST